MSLNAADDGWDHQMIGRGPLVNHSTGRPPMRTFLPGDARNCDEMPSFLMMSHILFGPKIDSFRPKVAVPSQIPPLAEG